MVIPLFRALKKANEAGEKTVNQKIKVLTNNIGVTGEAWNNPAKAKEKLGWETKVDIDQLTKIMMEADKKSAGL